MPRTLSAKRGRKPSIGTATERVRQLRRTLKSLVTEMSRLEIRLDELDHYYTRMAREKARVVVLKSRGPSTLRGRGPNVRDVAFEILKRAKGPLPIIQLAKRVHGSKGGRPGQHFAQNLGAALVKDRRFKREGRGVYGLR